MRRLGAGVAAATLVLLLAGCGSAAENQIRYVDMDSQSHATKTAVFNPAGSWAMTYSYDCKWQHSEGLKDLDRLNLDVFNSDDDSYAAEHPQVRATGSTGKQTLSYQRSGWYYVTIDSPCDWRLLVVDTSKA